MPRDRGWALFRCLIASVASLAAMVVAYALVSDEVSAWAIYAALAIVQVLFLGLASRAGRRVAERHMTPQLTGSLGLFWGLRLLGLICVLAFVQVFPLWDNDNSAVALAVSTAIVNGIYAEMVGFWYGFRYTK